MRKLKARAELEKYRAKQKKSFHTDRPTVTVCGGTGCGAFGGHEVRAAFEEEIAKAGLAGKVDVRMTGCHGFCERGPIVVILPEHLFYQKMTLEDVPEVVRQTLVEGEIVERLLYRDPRTGEAVVHDREIPFYARQNRLVFRHNGHIDPTRIEDYVANDGYAALAKALGEMRPEQVIEEVKASGLKGRGGAGFSTGMKWQFARQAAGDDKYVICNADEGDPGAFMDRSLLEGDPHSVIEGLAICAYAIGSSHGYVYVRAEYPVAVKHLGIALDQARELGLLGKDILGSGFDFDITVKEGAGAFVCGEETALMASIEGKRGMPRLRPPFPAQSGLWGKPTNINNVETLANVAPIVSNGAAWYASIGDEHCAGTKIFALAGKINNTGLVEVAGGTTLRELVYEIGGGIPNGRTFKAAQLGGPSGGCVPSQFLDIPIDYESLKEIGAIMGSGGVIITDETTCMVEFARFFTDFVQSESCGKCVPCRVGTRRMLELLTKITKGDGTREDLAKLKELASDIKETSLCGLGQTGPNPVLSTIRYFEDEYLAHIDEGRCPAGACEALAKAPCNSACPASVDTSSYVALVASGRFDEALAVHRERNPFPAICGRVCHHPCEVRCRRNDVDEPISIRAIKRFMAESGKLANERPMAHKAKSVAVVGAGPAGLSCAYQLALSGYNVTVLEKLPVAGGMMRLGIPEYRLPKKLVAAEIDAILALGVKLECGRELGKDFTVESLLEGDFDAVFVAVGAHKGKPARIEGEDREGVIQGVDFLRAVALGEEVDLGKKVAVIGGGDVALDAARTALRHGAEEVSVVYRRSREEMPAHEWDIVEGEEEGVVYEYMTMPASILHADGRATGLRCFRTELGERDESGRRSPVVIEGSDFDIEADTIVLAIGQDVDVECVDGCELDGKRVSVDKRLMTSRKGVFAGGDGVTGPATLVAAIGAGQQAAFEIDRYLSGGSLRETELIAREGRLVERATEEDVERTRPAEKALDPEYRKTCDAEVVMTMSGPEAIGEARRCLRCDLERAESKVEAEKVRK
ncbi:MAG: FAD-dependent oxidoreductase [Actinobacteria bacterium]|nr:MAG: FAD-dependent oxidoreductase [Actinomycetota bacterium]